MSGGRGAGGVVAVVGDAGTDALVVEARAVLAFAERVSCRDEPHAAQATSAIAAQLRARGAAILA